LLIEPGKLDCEPVAPLEHRIELPAGWRFALVIPARERGLSGDAERAAFGDLPAVSAETTAALVAELAEEIIPAATEGQFERFSESLYRYGHAAGMCFAARQGGPFASPRVANLVETIRSLGVHGVGQSSWGPTVFAVLPSEAAADDLLMRLGPHLVDEDQTLVTAVCRSGARIEVVD
jgi:predicted sugar kinase